MSFFGLQSSPGEQIVEEIVSWRIPTNNGSHVETPDELGGGGDHGRDCRGELRTISLGKM